ncbi:MAG: hypothetical protein HY812_18660 [Planctomycetes bacterium]|nr:hypothetical protein [Planctomycetota bacterium]
MRVAARFLEGAAAADPGEKDEALAPRRPQGHLGEGLLRCAKEILHQGERLVLGESRFGRGLLLRDGLAGGQGRLGLGLCRGRRRGLLGSGLLHARQRLHGRRSGRLAAAREHGAQRAARRLGRKEPSQRVFQRALFVEPEAEPALGFAREQALDDLGAAEGQSVALLLEPRPSPRRLAAQDMSLVVHRRSSVAGPGRGRRADSRGERAGGLRALL